jgi:5-methylcytosine-specific restriction endonuclease McrA
MCSRDDDYFKEYYKKRPFNRGFGYDKKCSGSKEIYALEVDTSKLIGDHIMPIACGGDEFDIDNVQTLCERCNKIKTKRDMAEIASMRQAENAFMKGQTSIWDLIDK